MFRLDISDAYFQVPLAVSAGSPAPSDVSPSLTLPAANLGVTALRLEGAGAAYSRRIRVWERVFFRGRWYEGLYLHAGATAPRSCLNLRSWQSTPSVTPVWSLSAGMTA